MGRSLTSVQVYIGDRPGPEVQAVLVEALRRHVLQGPYVEPSQEGDDDDSDRDIWVGPPGASPWLTVYDTLGDQREFARQVSLAVDGTTVFVNLFDSDVLHLRRYSRGEVVADCCNAPQLCDVCRDSLRGPARRAGKDRKKLKAPAGGDLGAWRDLMVEGTDLDTLRQIWDSEPVLADDILWATVDALAMNRDEIDADYRPGLQGFTRLAFRLKETPLYRLKAEGLPRLTVGGDTDLTEVYAGAELALQLSIRNEGGAGVGLDIVAWGGAIEQGIVSLEKAVVEGLAGLLRGAGLLAQAGLLLRASVGAAPAEDTQELPFSPGQARLGDEERRILQASSGTLALPRGTAGDLEAMIQPGVNPFRILGALLGSQIQVRVLGSIEKPGAGDLFIGFVPHGNRQEGQATYHASLQALPMPRRPLRCLESRHARFGVLLRPLEEPKHLFALVSMGAGPEDSARVVADAIEAWAARTAGKKAGPLTAHLRTRLDLMPGEERLWAADIPGSDRWRELRGQLAGCVSFAVEQAASSVFFDMSHRYYRYYQASAEEPVPHLRLRFVAEALGESELRETGEWLADLVDRVMVAAAGLQALVGRWDWERSTAIDPTPYESACGVNGQCTTGRFWCAKFLRGVTERLWLGPELVARLGGTGGLAPIATTTPVGEAVRVTLKEGATLDQLEQVLAPLLPGEQDWREGTERLHARV